ncbi:alpha/beta fold hydrolase [Thermanaerothrix sp. 4228-RoL]|uniref:Alpha/beta fold hydrolase n=1 Tax=Thermanaerothrix solaris TaxID=3058434 RepID=A0ABU3NM50_9CHLR|nr:alpha/beta fold hydrolase [Thermanaerothrix sp. 4228-RoL]MDT8897930.1 alpha/beta fold hydrolase [Thermanaerothrix sp. 4228-RoL]
MIATTAPLRILKAPPSILKVDYEKVEFLTSDGLTLRGWFFPAADPAAPAILYAPATAKDQRQGLSLVRPLHEAGYHVLLFSYRGSGESDGNRFVFSYGARESQDVDAAVRYLVETRGITCIGGIGHSAGAVALILSAARNPNLHAVVAAAPFPSLEDAWRVNRPTFFPPPLYEQVMRLAEWRKGFTRDEVRPLDVVHRLSPRPILFVFGQADRRIPPDQAKRLYEAAEEPKDIIWLPEASHEQVRSPGLDFLMPQLVDFFRRNLHSNATCFHRQSIP